MAQKEKSIILSEKYGVNPSVTHCECCGKSIGVVMFGRLKGDVEAPKDVYMGLCDSCQSVVDQDGLLIIEVRDGETGNNPYRTGRITGITKDAKERMFHDISGNMAYMEHEMFQHIFGDVKFTAETKD